MKTFTIHDAGRAIGELVEFSDGTVACSLPAEGMEFAGTLDAMRRDHPTWEIVPDDPDAAVLR